MRNYLIILLVFLALSCQAQPNHQWLLNRGAGTTIVISPTDSIMRYGDSVWAVGTSITSGVAASGAHLSYVDRLEDTIGCIIDNSTLAIAGQGTDMCMREINQYVAINQTRPAIVDVGTNDINLSYDKTYLKKKIKYSIINMIASMFLSSVTPASDLSVSGSGSRADIATDYGQRSQYISGKKAQTFSGVGYTISHTFTGTNVVISMIAVDSTNLTSPQFRILIDGTVRDTFDIEGWSRNPDFTTSTGLTQSVGFVYLGLASGSHTVSIEILEGTKQLRIDYIGQMRAPGSCRGVMVMSPPYCTNTYYTTSGGNRFDDGVIDTYGKEPAFEAADLFISGGYRVAKYNPNLYYTPINPTTTADGLHPNNEGHRLFYTGGIYYNTH